ncbi:MAG: ATP synthase F1 subunit gamma [candidate division SR1 bacterium]|nr:ATP synthase F1 subunit gamma [candidate division SR1 bacterium]
MANTKLIREKIKSVGNLQKIIKALEIVSTIKLQKLKTKTNNFKNFMLEFLRVLESLKNHINIFDFDHKKWSEEGRRLIIVVSSDKGLCGGINTKLMKHIAQKYQDANMKKDVDIIAIGKKALEFFVRDGWNVVASTPLKDNFDERDLHAIYVYINQAIAQKTYAKIKVYFNFFKNIITQVPLRFKLYPLDKESFAAFLQDLNIAPDATLSFKKHHDLVIEPHIKDFKSNLIQELTEMIIYHAALHNKTGEHAARMLAMKNAKDNCGDIMGGLQLIYNKTRQSKITQEISEIVSAKLAIEQN